MEAMEFFLSEQTLDLGGSIPLLHPIVEMNFRVADHAEIRQEAVKGELLSYLAE